LAIRFYRGNSRVSILNRFAAPLRLCGFALILFAPPALGGEWSGSVAAEWRGFFYPPVDAQQHGGTLSLSALPQYYHSWDDGRQGFAFVPFLRLDQHDNERSHFDIRELTWVKAARRWELRVGIRKLFWGVTESQHLVDIINQTDLVESPDGEEKLGQPMINLAVVRDWGTLDLFVLPGFRERTFPGPRGRLRGQPWVDADHAVYESGRKRRHIDAAARWSRTIGIWDMGLSHFYGTSREPRLVPGTDGGGSAVWIPHYDLIHQTGLDVQATQGNWLWKLEAIRRSGQGSPFWALSGGFEYTLYGVGNSPADLGLLVEYHYDERGAAAPTPLQDDVMVGVRLNFNDVQSTEALIGLIADRRSSARSFSMEASRRLTDHWKLALDLRAYQRLPTNDPLYGLRDDDYLQLELTYHF